MDAKVSLVVAVMNPLKAREFVPMTCRSVEQKLEVHLTSGVVSDGEMGVSATELCSWFDANLPDPMLVSKSKIERIAIRCVLDAACKPGEPPVAPKLCTQIERLSKLLRKCTAHGTLCTLDCQHVKQMGLLHEVQGFCDSHSWPLGLIKKLFYQLYETDVVSEKAFHMWQEDVIDDTPGKDKALFQVRSRIEHATRFAYVPSPPGTHIDT